MSDTKLLPCPFCGGNDISTFSGDGVFGVQCNTCMGSIDYCLTVDEAIKKWNTRKPIECIVEQLEEKKNMYIKCETDCKMCDCHGCDLDDSGYQFYQNAIDIVKKAGGSDVGKAL